MANVPATQTVGISTGVCLTASSAAAAEFSVQCRSNAYGGKILLKASATTAEITDWSGAWEIAAGDGLAEATIAGLWPGSTHTHLHCIAVGSPCAVTFASA